MPLRIDASSLKFLADLERIEERASRAQRKISSGLEVERPSDGPDRVRRILRLRAEIERNLQVQANLVRAQAEVDSAEAGLQGAVAALEEALALGLEGSGSLPSPEQRMALAQQVRALQEHLVAISRTSVEGRYIFGGDADGTPPYELDPASPTGVHALSAAPATRQIEDARGMRFVPGRAAQQIFEPAFAAVERLADGLEADNDAEIEAALEDLRAAGTHVNGELAAYGAMQKRLWEANSDAQGLEVQMRAELGALRDADVTAAILELEAAQTHREAALAAEAQRPRTSLFDYLA